MTVVQDKLTARASVLGMKFRELLTAYDNSLLTLNDAEQGMMLAIKAALHTTYDEGFKTGAIRRVMPDTIFTDTDDDDEYEVYLEEDEEDDDEDDD